MSKRFKTASWYVPGYVPLYREYRSDQEALEGTTLIAFNEGIGTYIPVFNSHQECDSFVRNVSNEHEDLAFTICRFVNLADIYEQIKEEFKDQKIKIVIKESTHEV